MTDGVIVARVSGVTVGHGGRSQATGGSRSKHPRATMDAGGRTVTNRGARPRTVGGAHGMRARGQTGDSICARSPRPRTGDSHGATTRKRVRSMPVPSSTWHGTAEAWSEHERSRSELSTQGQREQSRVSGAVATRACEYGNCTLPPCCGPEQWSAGADASAATCVRPQPADEAWPPGEEHSCGGSTADPPPEAAGEAPVSPEATGKTPDVGNQPGCAVGADRRFHLFSQRNPADTRQASAIGQDTMPRQPTRKESGNIEMPLSNENQRLRREVATKFVANSKYLPVCVRQLQDRACYMTKLKQVPTSIANADMKPKYWCQRCDLGLESRHKVVKLTATAERGQRGSEFRTKIEFHKPVDMTTKLIKVIKDKGRFPEALELEDLLEFGQEANPNELKTVYYVCYRCA